MNESVSTISLHETKGQPSEIPRMKIVEAYGRRKCPKLVEQILSEDITIRNNALACLKDDFLNQETLAGCIKESITRILCDFITSDNSTTRHLCAEALETASKSSIGITALQDEDCLPILMNALTEDNKRMRENVYSIICSLTKYSKGVDSCVRMGNAVSIFVKSLKTELSCTDVILQTLFNIVSFNQEGLRQAYQSSLVLSCLDYIKDSNQKSQIHILAMKTLGFMCFDFDCRKQAYDLNAVTIHAGFLKDVSANSNLNWIASVLIVLDGLTSDDDGKRAIFSCLGEGVAIEYIMQVIHIDHLAVRLNATKLIANIAVYPVTRKMLLSNYEFDKVLTMLAKDKNKTLAKHADIALKAIYWKP